MFVGKAGNLSVKPVLKKLAGMIDRLEKLCNNKYTSIIMRKFERRSIMLTLFTMVNVITLISIIGIIGLVINTNNVFCDTICA